MTIKKAFTAINAMLVENEDKKVKTIMPDLIELMSAKTAGGGASSVHRDSNGDVVAILDYYFKKWLPVNLIEFGAKANSATGLNTMCKMGVSLWTKQQRDFKKGKEDLLTEVGLGNVLPTDIQAALDDLETERAYIADFPVPEAAFDSIEEFDAADMEAVEVAIDTYWEAQAEPEEEAAE